MWWTFDVAILRAESNLYKERTDVQAKELNLWKQRVEELEEKERVANENVSSEFITISHMKNPTFLYNIYSL